MNANKLIFIRHAETKNSKNSLYQSPNSEILPINIKFARELRNKVRILDLNYILVSELDRSRQTADLFKVPIREENLLDEFREPTNLFDKKISASSSYIFDVICRYDNNPDYIREDGESLNSFITRILQFRAKVEDGNEKLTVCVGHGFYMRLFALLVLINREAITSKILSYSLNMKIEKLNYAAFIFKDGKWFLETWNSNIGSLSNQPE